MFPANHLSWTFSEVDEWLSRGTFAVQPKPIGALSTEVLGMILEEILDDTRRAPAENFLTCVYFSVTCKRLLSVGKRHILRALTSRYARAADCRIICLGKYANKNDQAPPGMLTDAAVNELATTRMPYEPSELDDEDLAQRCLSVFALELYKSYHNAKVEEHMTVYIPIDCTRDIRGRKEPPDSKERDLNMIAALACVRYYPTGPAYPDGPNVLCNLSKGECVREDALVRLESRWCSVTLAHAVLSRICCSPDSSMSMACSGEYEDRLAKGPWAGDQFRITSEADMPPLKGGQEWKDVTKDVNRMLRHLWNGEMDENEDEGEESTPSAS